jgi:hypothetical protein
LGVGACNWIKTKYQWFYDQFGYFWLWGVNKFFGLRDNQVQVKLFLLKC